MIGDPYPELIHIYVDVLVTKTKSRPEKKSCVHQNFILAKYEYK